MSDECIAARRLSSILNKSVMTINWNEMPAVLTNVTTKVDNIFRYWLGPYMSDNQVNVMNTANQITVGKVMKAVIVVEANLKRVEYITALPFLSCFPAVKESRRAYLHITAVIAPFCCCSCCWP